MAMPSPEVAMPSISVQDLGDGRYKVRWRELLPGDTGLPERGADGRIKRRARSLVVHGKASRDEAVARIRRALLDEGEFHPATAAPAPTPPANLELAALEWLDWKKTRCKPSSVVSYASHMKAFFEIARQLEAIPAQAPVAATVLSRGLVIQCVRHWQGLGRSESWVYSAARSVVDLWRWASDDPDRFYGIPLPPRETKAVLPRGPVYVAPPAPTIAEIDACLRHLPPEAEESRRIGVTMRFTGLRVSQVLALGLADVDTQAATIVVRTGRTRREEALARTIPISPHLAADMARWFEHRDAIGPAFPLWGRTNSSQTAASRSQAFRAAWSSATQAGEARRAVWDPPNRKLARPQHGFRAAFQAFMRSKGVGDEVTDALVGHAGRSVRERHYAGPESLWGRMVEAVALIQPVDWVGPKHRAGGKVVELVGPR